MLGSNFFALLVLCLAVTNVRADSSDDTQSGVTLPQNANDDTGEMSTVTVGDIGGEEHNGDVVDETLDPQDVISAMEKGALHRKNDARGPPSSLRNRRHPQTSQQKRNDIDMGDGFHDRVPRRFFRNNLHMLSLAVIAGPLIAFHYGLDVHNAKPCTDFFPNHDNVHTATVKQQGKNLWALRDSDTEALLYYIKKEGKSPNAKYEIFTENEEDDTWYLQQSDDNDFVGNFGPGMEDVVIDGSDMSLILNGEQYDSTYNSYASFSRTWTFAGNNDELSDKALISAYNNPHFNRYKICTVLDEDSDKKKALLGVLSTMIKE